MDIFPPTPPDGGTSTSNTHTPLLHQSTSTSTPCVFFFLTENLPLRPKRNHDKVQAVWHCFRCFQPLSGQLRPPPACLPRPRQPARSLPTKKNQATSSGAQARADPLPEVKTTAHTTEPEGARTGVPNRTPVRRTGASSASFYPACPPTPFLIPLKKRSNLKRFF